MELAGPQRADRNVREWHRLVLVVSGGANHQSDLAGRCYRHVVRALAMKGMEEYVVIISGRLDGAFIQGCADGSGDF